MSFWGVPETAGATSDFPPVLSIGDPRGGRACVAILPRFGEYVSAPGMLGKAIPSFPLVLPPFPIFCPRVGDLREGVLETHTS